jgi:AraC family transcriptional regulator
MKLFIKNMVCNRCIMVVNTELEKLGLHPAAVTLGEVTLTEVTLSMNQIKAVETMLTAAGFELIDDKKSRIIEKIKTAVINIIHYTADQPREKYSELIAKELHYDYPYLSKLFSEVEGITIEQYIISQKIEKIKEYIVYDELNLTEIADRMGYSSVAHLSAQFKKATGLPPSHFKNVGATMRRSIDSVSKS